MSSFLGEYDCKLDTKGRVRLPGSLHQQISPEAESRFVINRGFEKCLVLYPYDVWQRVRAKVDKLNTFKKKERNFVRIFYRGATEVKLDSADRLNLPKHLLEYAGIKKELILAAHKNTMEVWNKDTYEIEMGLDSDEYADLAEDVMGDGFGEEDNNE